MTPPKISKPEWPIMEALWRWGALSIREITTGICGPDRRPAYSTVQTMVYRLEARGAVRRVEKIGNYHVFEASVTREIAEGRIDQSKAITRCALGGAVSALPDAG